MVLDNFKEIKTERLLLRRLKKTDWESISFLRTDQQVNRFVDRSAAPTKEEALAFIEKIDTEIKKKSSYYWAITEIGIEKMIGSICLWNFSDDMKVAETGYDLSPVFQKKGIMREALEAILKFGFNTLNLKKIEAYTHVENLPSKLLLERVGFELVRDKIDEYNANNVVYSLSKLSTL